MRIAFACVLMVLLLLVACTTPSIDYESTVDLDAWYELAGETEGLQVWGPIPYPMPSGDGITVNRLRLESDRFSTEVDIYLPTSSESNKPFPVIIFPQVFSRADLLDMLGASVLTWDYLISWAHLLSGNGYAVVVLESNSPSKGLADVITYLRENHKAIGIDPLRIGFQAISSNPGVILQYLSRSNTDTSGLQAAVFLYPDLRAVPFSSIEHIPYFIATGELDRQRTNDEARLFADKCEEAGVECIHVHHPNGQHGFDYFQDDKETAEIISALMEFYRIHLSP